MHKNYYYDGPDGLRARLTDIETAIVTRSRLVIRAEHGQGALIMNKTYTTHRGARSALNRRGACWTLYKKSTF